jgi:hypothetical protein
MFGLSEAQIISFGLMLLGVYLFIRKPVVSAK